MRTTNDTETARVGAAEARRRAAEALQRALDRRDGGGESGSR